ncbi:glycosyltransferase family 4 protein [Halomarina ordinaria]|uniref:Glycosyltransferase family 4 protein n=1 Tax=Halomarina ordinaria TaxID=3033939 RepID=A0ABD5U4V1_9EURY|nr:glycosyltransferase family 4 protein [Halomarina sp. PSRA2]
MFKNIDGVVPLTTYLKDEMVREGMVDESDTFVAHDGVDLTPYRGTSKERAREELGLPLAEKFVMYTGHLYPRKGVQFLAEVAREIQGTVLVVGGYQEDIDRIQSQVPTTDNLEFTGFVEPSRIHTYQLSADVLVAPYTREAWMPSPLKLFEYMATGNPIVASSIPTIEEVLTHERNGLLVPPGDADQLGDEINRLLDDRELASEIAATARNDVEQYTWTKRASDILDFIEQKVNR